MNPAKATPKGPLTLLGGVADNAGSGVKSATGRPLQLGGLASPGHLSELSFLHPFHAFENVNDIIIREVKVLVAQLCQTLCNPMDCSPSGSSVRGILRQEYCRGLPLPSPGDLPDPGIKPGSPALSACSLLSEPPAKAQYSTANALTHWSTVQGHRHGI